MMPRGPDSPLTWKDFLHDCGPRAQGQLGRKQSTVEIFHKKYHKKTFRWQGELINIREGMEIFIWRTRSILSLRMVPSRFRLRDGPDIVLLFGEEHNHEVANMSPGDWIEFEATMAAHGRRGDPEVMMLWSAKAAKRPDNVDFESNKALFKTNQ